jgi:hypothetical protein
MSLLVSERNHSDKISPFPKVTKLSYYKDTKYTFRFVHIKASEAKVYNNLLKIKHFQKYLLNNSHLRFKNTKKRKYKLKF